MACGLSRQSAALRDGLNAETLYVSSRTSANTVFVIIASLVMIGMAFTPIISVVEPTVSTALMLEIMHLAAGHHCQSA